VVFITALHHLIDERRAYSMSASALRRYAALASLSLAARSRVSRASIGVGAAKNMRGETSGRHTWQNSTQTVDAKRVDA